MDALSSLHASLDQGARHRGAKLVTHAHQLSEARPTLTSEHTNEEVRGFFAQNEAQNNIAIVDDGRPIGLINRNMFMEAYARPFARDVFGRRSCIAWMHKEPLVVDENTALEPLIAAAVSTGERVLKDGFITVDAQGIYTGIGTGFSLVQAMSALEAEKTRQLLDSIHYASRIQRAYLKASNESVQRGLPGHGLLWQPRDIVGGDCYFFRDFDDGMLGGLIDCTGHGVPGAFMTLIALSWMEQMATQGYDRDDPGALLARLNRFVKTVIDQRQADKGWLGEAALQADDGMDAALFWMPRGEATLRWSSARLPLFVAEPGKPLRLIDGDRAAVGYASTDMDHQWPNHELALTPNQRLLAVTDGIIDQVGGPRRIALGKRRLGEFFQQVCADRPERIAVALEAHFTDWQGSERRRDDVTALCWSLDGARS
ncbi:MAG: SpoIIE family protein phosphatase [Aquabacterium sp.]|nr:SpoIIE family protein phosphatase [Aquabacterium sp.]